jgi:hypothetical protein
VAEVAQPLAQAMKGGGTFACTANSAQVRKQLCLGGARLRIIAGGAEGAQPNAQPRFEHTMRHIRSCEQRGKHPHEPGADESAHGARAVLRSLIGTKGVQHLKDATKMRPATWRSFAQPAKHAFLV